MIMTAVRKLESDRHTSRKLESDRHKQDHQLQATDHLLHDDDCTQTAMHRSYSLIGTNNNWQAKGSPAP